MPEIKETTRLKDLWNEEHAQAIASNQLAMLRYRSNLLGRDLRITNFGGGNTSSKLELPDPFTGRTVRVLAVKGSGGDLGSITEAGFALLYLDRLEQLKELYRGEEYEDEMVRYYPLSAFGENRVAASIDTPLHAFLPFDHVDHLHPDWAIALAASANGKRKLDEFNREFGRKILWVPWQRPGFELALMIERAVKENRGAEGLILGGHGLFTWGARELGSLGTSCPDHFLRTRVCPLFLSWNPEKDDVSVLKARIQDAAVGYRAAYKKYYDAWANADSPKLRDSNPSVVVVPGLGL